MEKLINENFHNFQNNERPKLKAVIFGATGSVGRELVRELCLSDAWDHVLVITRRRLEEWKQFQDKIRVYETPNFDELIDLESWKIVDGYDSCFCCLGSRTKLGKEIFYKVDYAYVLNTAMIALRWNIYHYSMISSEGSDPDSIFLYMKTKGQIEEKLKKLKLNILSIFKPGAIIDRENQPRFIEKLIKYMPLVPKIKAKQLAIAMRKESEIYNSEGNGLTDVNLINIYNNSQIKSFLDIEN